MEFKYQKPDISKNLLPLWGKIKNSSGQALITLLFYVIIILTVSTAAVLLIANDSITASKLQDGSSALMVAEAGMENAFLRLLRDPNYAGESNLLIGSGSATITVTHGPPIVLRSIGTLGKFTRTVEVTTVYSGGQYTITSWKEVP